MPRAETTNSPRDTTPPADRAAPFTGLPKCRAIAADQWTAKPMLAGAKGASATPAPARTGAQAPSDPSRAQLAPPSANTVAPASTRTGPSGVANSAAAPSQPCQRQPVRTLTPSPASCPAQALSSGEAFIATGNTRPVDPVNTGCPSPRAQSCTWSGPKAASIGASQSAAAP